MNVCVFRFIYVINCNLLIWMDDMPHTWIVRYAKQSKVSTFKSHMIESRVRSSSFVCTRSTIFYCRSRNALEYFLSIIFLVVSVFFFFMKFARLRFSGCNHNNRCQQDQNHEFFTHTKTEKTIISNV